MALNDAASILKALMSNPHISLGDLVYEVRGREGMGWDGPAVKQWSDAATAVKQWVKENS